MDKDILSLSHAVGVESSNCSSTNLKKFLLFVNRKKYILQLVCDIPEFVYIQDCCGQLLLIISAAFSATIMIAAIGFEFGTRGKIEASATRMFGMPCTRSCESTTASESVLGPILHVPDWWFSGPVSARIWHIQKASVPKW